MIDQLINSSKGAFLGLAIGDALGTTNEFKTGNDIKIIDDIVGGGVFELAPGQWTDDTSMALCLADSLIENGFDLKDQLDRYCDWQENGVNSCTGTCFDIGMATYDALRRYKTTGNVFSGSTNDRSSGNGNIMRLAPVIIKYNDDLQHCINAAEMQGITTHGSYICKEAAALMAEIMFRAFKGQTKDEMLRPASFNRFSHSLISAINDGSYKKKSVMECWTSGGFVASTLEFALACFYRTDNFADCVLLAANAGGDSDTNAAVAGQIAGAFYGVDGIPTEWIRKTHWNQRISLLTAKLL